MLRRETTKKRPNYLVVIFSLSIFAIAVRLLCFWCVSIQFAHTRTACTISAVSLCLVFRVCVRTFATFASIEQLRVVECNGNVNENVQQKIM